MVRVIRGIVCVDWGSDYINLLGFFLVFEEVFYNLGFYKYFYM